MVWCLSKYRDNFTLTFTDNVNLLQENINIIKKTKTVLDAYKEIGLESNIQKPGTFI